MFCRFGRGYGTVEMNTITVEFHIDRDHRMHGLHVEPQGNVRDRADLHTAQIHGRTNDA